MAFIGSVPEDGAKGETARWYAADRDQRGYLPNYSKVFSHRPAAYAAWKELGGAISGAMDPRRYELATLAAAKVLRSSYCWPTARSWPSGSSAPSGRSR
jgi:alkylhydroperoxidase family enzyme